MLPIGDDAVGEPPWFPALGYPVRSEAFRATHSRYTSSNGTTASTDQIPGTATAT
jgi:hypothetical protein